MASFNSKLTDYIDRLDFSKVFLFLFLLGSAVYLNTVYYPFLLDDRFLIFESPYVAGEGSWISAFFAPAALGQDVPAANQYYRPVVDLVYRLQYHCFGSNATGYHLVNIAVHVANAALVYLLGIFLSGGRKGFAFAAAALFLVHPVQTEAVASIAGLSNLLLAFWCFVSFVLYLSASRKSAGSRRVCIYGLALFAFIMALFSKEQAVLFPAVVLLYEICFGSFVLNWRRWSGFLIAGGGYLALRGLVLGQSFLGLFQYSKELWLRVAAIPQTVLMHLKVPIVPYDLHYYRSVDILQPFVAPTVILGLLTVVLIFMITRVADKRMLIFGLGWFVFLLVPLSILPLINEYSFVLASEHFLYLPLAGFLFFILALLREGVGPLVRGREYTAAVAAFAAAAVIFAGIAIKQNTYWRGDIPLLKRMLRFEKDFGRGHLLLGRSFLASGEIDAAVFEYKRVLDIISGYSARTRGPAKDFYLFLIKLVYLDLGRCYEAKRQPEEARDHYEKALIIDPGFAPALRNLEKFQ